MLIKTLQTQKQITNKDTNDSFHNAIQMCIAVQQGYA